MHRILQLTFDIALVLLLLIPDHGHGYRGGALASGGRRRIRDRLAACATARLPTQECAEFEVPLDYDEPDGATISLALARVPATDQANRIGSLLLNPGGPGGSGVMALPLQYAALPEALHEQFDIVEFDPRGIGESAPVRCFASIAEQIRACTSPRCRACPLVPRKRRRGNARPRSLPNGAGSATPTPLPISRRRTWRVTWTGCGKLSATSS